ncbi:pyrimidine 5'-nucleotidase [Candidatus Pelagibacter communis]|uniref:pyrimidine 5'-nucleotidase n=1 Tax=Pelagibacter ubique TaxID=198252 RepID=UPI000147B4A6|nr:pyrimidine 5'-nucleotidase [Candidatus Pelagibacter ubique]|tara:strand:- start:154 stop:825 length:672 start_codon:yes stop_codon:yes gene_type:complete
MKNLANIKNILFDCDGVLYQDLEAVFGQVSKKMTEYISKKLNIDLIKAKELQTNYFHKYNTSLNGLMIHHDIPPREFLDYVHDIDLSFLEKDKTLRYELENIKLNKYVFTNGSKEHVKNITTHLGIDDQFDGVFDIVDAEYHPKPEAKAFDLMVQKFKIDPNETLYIEDIAKNLSIGKERGTITAWLINDEYWGKKESEKDYIDYKIENLSLFLKEIRLLKNS